MAAFEPRTLLGSNNLDDLIKRNLNPNVKQFDLGFGIDQNKLANKDYKLFSSGNIPTYNPLKNVSTSYMWDRNTTFKEIERKFDVADRKGAKPVLDTHKVFFSTDATKTPVLHKQDNTNLRGFSADYFGIPDRKDIKIETAAVNELHMNTRTGHFEPVTSKQIQSMNAQIEDDTYADAAETYAQQYIASRKSPFIPELMQKSGKVAARSREKQRNDASAVGGGPAPPVVRPAITPTKPPAAGGKAAPDASPTPILDFITGKRKNNKNTPKNK